MLRKEDLNQVQELIESFKPGMTYFEQKILVPNIQDRLRYLIKIFEDFQRLAQDKGVALHIDAALRKVVNPNQINLAVPELQVGEQYLAAVNRICRDEYINPANDILNRFPLDDTKRSIEATTEFLNVTKNFFQTIVDTQDRPFSYMLRSFINIKNTSSGEILLGPPQELTLILMPFQTRLTELVSSAKSTVESIEHWGKQISVQRTKHTEIITHVGQVKSATEQTRAARYNMYFQVAVILFTIILVVGAEKAGTYLEKRELDAALTAAEARARVYVETITSQAKKINELETAVKALRTKAESTPHRINGTRPKKGDSTQ